ncbi:Protein ecdysoneless-like protein [Dichanthelium oligosanthes]|uniref:Protein ecdysoneless-like protein n=1 Tax=Dichanthelium oligosanthes TaxID=888268 RepID=A0A1E5W2K7_9POAL|nr:Protein ecdysoneless-like protein [Dichanthelium oligosanthes]
MIAAGAASMVGRAATPSPGAQSSRWPRAVARLRLALRPSEAAAGSGRWTACFRPAPSPAAAAAVKEAKGRPPEVEVEPARGGGEDVWSADADAEVAQGGGFPEHLVIMVNGLVGSADDWKFAAEQFVTRMPDKVIVHRSQSNSATQTFDGVDFMGERLANEVLSVVEQRNGVKKISFVAHSLGGLVARYAIGRLYEPNNRSKSSAGKSRYDVEHLEGLIAGLEPMNFITFASPHLGSSGNKQHRLLVRDEKYPHIVYVEKEVTNTNETEAHANLYDPEASPCALCASPPVPHLHGALRFGDSLPDEWLAVSLLFALTRAFPDMAARAWDSDGEFLLIEAAFALPRWLDPESAPNRVFIFRGELHILPPSLFPETPSLEAALAAVHDGSVDTRAPDAVQAAIQRRIAGLPERAAENLHTARVIVPAPVAKVLKEEPCLIARAVEGFYDRDIDTMKHAARMEKFLKGPSGEEVEMVRTSVRMTRAMYAQLVQQNFQAPRGYPMPRREEGPEKWMEAELGMKIACGFEMMYQERRRQGEEGKGSTWEVYLKSLEATGCFEGLLPGSKEYKKVMENAMQYYKSSTLYSRTREILSEPVCRIDEILSMPYSADEFKGVDLPPSDDDSWLYGGEEELNVELRERQKELEEYEAAKKHRKSQKQSVSGSSKSQADQFKLGEITESMQDFVRKMSSFEGAEVPADRREMESVDLDVNQFLKAMESVLGGGLREQAGSDDSFDRKSSSSAMDFDDSDEENDFAEELGDKDVDDSFMESYSDALNKELSSTTLEKSFARAPRTGTNDEGPSNASATDGEMTPVDVDLNLVESILNSYSSQQGLPGPASNLLGLMGVKVPPDSKKS